MNTQQLIEQIDNANSGFMRLPCLLKPFESLFRHREDEDVGDIARAAHLALVDGFHKDADIMDRWHCSAK